MRLRPTRRERSSPRRIAPSICRTVRPVAAAASRIVNAIFAGRGTKSKMSGGVVSGCVSTWSLPVIPGGVKRERGDGEEPYAMEEAKSRAARKSHGTEEKKNKADPANGDRGIVERVNQPVFRRVEIAWGDHR